MKPIEELTFTDDYMFGYVMKNTEICKGVLERLLNIKIEKLDFPELQRSIVIFVCKDDYFGKNFPCYSFSNICHENHSICLDDKTHKIIFNAGAFQNEKDLEKMFSNNRSGKDALPLSLHTASGTASQVLQSLTGYKQYTNNVEKVHSTLRIHFLYGSKFHAALSLF